MISRFLTVLFIALFGLNSITSALSNSDNNSDDKIVLTNSDRKKLEKAEKEAQKSKDLMQEADKQYADIASKQAELTAEETEKKNNKALAKQIEGLKSLQSANKMKFDVYAAKADEFWKKFKGTPSDMSYAKSLESNARIGFQSSQEQYKTAEGIDDKLISYSNMSSATDLSNKSVDDIKKAFDIYASTSFTQTFPSQPVIEKKAPDTLAQKTDTTHIPEAIIKPVKDTSSSNIYRTLKINEDMVDRFNKFMKESYPQDYEKYIIDFPNLNFSDVEGIRDAWYRYLYGEENTAKTGTTDTTKKNISDSTMLAMNDTSKNRAPGGQTLQPAEDREKVLSKLRSQHRNKSGTTAETGQTYNEEQGTQVNKSGKRIKRSAQDYVTGASDTTIVKGFTYKVQIVASRVPLNSDMLKAIYSGPERPEETNEDEWYKYAIGPFLNYAMARQFRENCQVNDAFIIELLNGKKINSNEALISPFQNSNSFTNFKIDESVIFKVQVAACRNEMTPDELRKIYDKPEELESSQEDGWYKYSFSCGNDFGKACDLLKNIRIAGAFISAYRNGQRIELKEAFTINVLPSN